MLSIISGFILIYVMLSLIGILSKRKSIYDGEIEQKNSMENKKVKFIFDDKDDENADGTRGHLEEIGISNYKNSVYDKYTKRVIDKIISFIGLIVLSPIFLIIFIAIKIDDPGPVLFTQKRVGKNKQYFKLHKFRSMKMCTPHDIPTHMLENPEQYITKLGAFLRKSSLDELPQIWDIFIGNMSIIGPRPALWNQDVLISLRDNYNANDIRPGLTGWAQINGRDELELETKAKLDGEYVKRESLSFDIKCFIGTIFKVVKSEGIVEGKKSNEKTNGKPIKEKVKLKQ